LSRPTLRTPEIEIRICTALANGVPLLTQCKADDMPDPATVYQWLRDSPEFASLYATARMDGAHTFFDRALSVAEDLPFELEGQKVVEMENGDQKVIVKVDNALVTRNKLLVHALHTAAEKLLPRVYAPKIGIGGADDLPKLVAAPVFPTTTGSPGPDFDQARHFVFLAATFKNAQLAMAEAQRALSPAAQELALEMLKRQYGEQPPVPPLRLVHSPRGEVVE
jgi:hypothetical protein